MPDDRTPVIRRTGSVFPKDTSGADVVMQSTLAHYQREQDSIQRGAGEPAKKEAAAKKAAAQKKHSTVNRVALGNAEAYAQQIYVNGRLVTVYNLYNDKGEPVQVETLGGVDPTGKAGDAIGSFKLPDLTPGQRSEYTNAEKNRQSTYSVLGINDIEQDSRFIMGRGDPVDSQGQTFYDTDRGRAIAEQNLVKHRPGIDDQGRPLNRNTSATNMMTISGGVTWFKQLSQKDPDAYNEMVKLLVDSQYLPKEKARTGVYTLDAARAFAYAAADAAQNNEAGGQDDLRSFLTKVATSAGANKQDEYTPVNRSYADPAALAQQARQAAQDALGRALTPEEEKRFTAHFRGQEDNYYDQIDAAGRAKTGARVADPNASGEADAFVRSPEFDADRSKQLLGSYMDAFMKMVNGG